MDFPKAHAVPFGPSARLSTAFAMDERFKAWPALNTPQVAAAVGVGRRSRLDPRQHALQDLFQGDTLPAKLGRALMELKAVDRKECFETFEFFSQVRSSTASSSAAGARTLVDVAGGHGLLAVLFAVFERRKFDHVLVVDTQRPAAFDKVLAAGKQVAPWVQVEYISGPEADMFKSEGALLLPTGCAVVCVHGCNKLTVSHMLYRWTHPLHMRVICPIHVCPDGRCPDGRCRTL